MEKKKKKTYPVVNFSVLEIFHPSTALLEDVNFYVKLLFEQQQKSSNSFGPSLNALDLPNFDFL
jgi:hypothetical protein